MTRESAKTAVNTSAFIVATIWAYRKLTEGNTSPTGHFLTGFFFVYISLAILADSAPPVGGMLAWLVAAGDLLTNGQGLVTDLNKGLQTEATAAAPTTPSTGKGG
jgi:hypothetical protein